jgi:diaminopimelate epimerase
MKNIEFIKMHGLGNDFVIVDTRLEKYSFSDDEIRLICSRYKGVGCDQFVLIELSDNADCFVRFYNSDGSESGACGNASRCVAWLMIEEKGVDDVVIETTSGLLNCIKKGENLVSVDMGEAKTDWRNIPLSREVDTLSLPVSCGDLSNGVAVNVGNPHAVFFVDNVDDVKLEVCGAKLETDALFPQRANISAAQIISKNEIKLRVWERGAGETSACGTGACATFVAANKKGFVSDSAEIILPGGKLLISCDNDHIIMTGPVTEVFKGTLL